MRHGLVQQSVVVVLAELQDEIPELPDLAVLEALTVVLPKQQHPLLGNHVLPGQQGDCHGFGLVPGCRELHERMTVHHAVEDVGVELRDP